MNVAEIQSALRDEKLDGWLFFDHHQRDPLAYRVLNFMPQGIISRRWYYFIPAEGDPRGLVHKIESHHLDTLPGSITAYAGWQEQKQGIAKLVEGAKRIAMQYSAGCAVPYVSMVDAGTIELVRGMGVEIATSANLVQHFEARLNADQRDSHFEAGKLVDGILSDTFILIGDRLRSATPIDEWQAQEYIRQRFTAAGLFTDHGPNVSVNANASNPHYEPQQNAASRIQAGDQVLIDLWAKFDRPEAVYYDITWMGYCGATPPAAFEKAFDVVRTARDRAIERVQKAAAAGEPLCGFQVDDAAREYIVEQGYGEYFYHRTGHSIGTDVHGTGANMDNLETHDERRVIPWTIFSIEPGVYMNDFGVRCEVNMFVGEGNAQVTGRKQDQLVLIQP